MTPRRLIDSWISALPCPPRVAPLGSRGKVETWILPGHPPAGRPPPPCRNIRLLQSHADPLEREWWLFLPLQTQWISQQQPKWR